MTPEEKLPPHPLDQENGPKGYAERLFDTYEEELEASVKILDGLPPKYLKALVRLFYKDYWHWSRAATAADPSDTYSMIEANNNASAALRYAYQFDQKLYNKEQSMKEDDSE